MANQDQIQAGAIQHHIYYRVEFLAEILGVHRSSIYLAMGGQRNIPLPKATRLGSGRRPMVRFLGRDILDWLVATSPSEMQEAPPSKPSAKDRPTPVARGRGRPRKTIGKS